MGLKVGTTTRGGLIVSIPSVDGSNLDIASAANLQVPRWDAAQAKFVYQNKPTFRPEDFASAAEADDTGAIQRAATAAIAVGGTLDLRSRRQLVASDTITLLPASGSQFYLNIEGDGRFDAISFTAANKPLFYAKGWKRSSVRSVNVRLASAASGAVAWDLDADASYGSLAQVTWYDCNVTTGSAIPFVGWRIGHIDPTGADFSFLGWVNCHVSGVLGTTGQIGWLNEGGNSLNNFWHGGSCLKTDVAVTNRASAGATRSGNASMFLYAFGTSQCRTDFDFVAAGSYSIIGGRFENGVRFLNTDLGGGTASCAVTLQGCTIAGYDPPDGIVFALDASSTLSADNIIVRRRSGTSDPDYTASLFSLTGGSTARGHLALRGSTLQAAEPFYTITGLGGWGMELIGNRYRTVTGSVTSAFRDYIRTPTDSNDTLLLGAGAGTVASYVGFNPNDSASTPRVRVGFDGGAAVIDGGTGRPSRMKSNNRTLVEANTTGQTVFGGGTVRKRTAPPGYPYTILATDHYIAASGASAGRVVNLPAATTQGQEFVIKNRIGGSAVSVAPNGTDTIDNTAAAVSVAANAVLRLISDGASNWEVV